MPGTAPARPRRPQRAAAAQHSRAERPGGETLLLAPGSRGKQPRHLPGAAMVRGWRGRGRSPSLTSPATAAQHFPPVATSSTPAGRSVPPPGPASPQPGREGARRRRAARSAREPGPAGGCLRLRSGRRYIAFQGHGGILLPLEGNSVFPRAPIVYSIGGRGNGATTRKGYV